MSQLVKDSIILLLTESKDRKNLKQKDVQEICQLLLDRWRD